MVALLTNVFPFVSAAAFFNSETIPGQPNVRSHLQVVNEKSPEVAAPSKQHVAVGFEDAALHQDAAVTEEVSLALLIELEQQFRQVTGHFHVDASVRPEEESQKISKEGKTEHVVCR